MAAIPIGIIAGMGALGTIAAGLVPWISSYFENKDVSDGWSKQIKDIKTKEDEINEDIERKYNKMKELLQRVLHTEYMITKYIPDSLFKLINLKANITISDINYIYQNIDTLKQNPDLVDIIFKKFKGFLKYREPYIRIVKNSLELFIRVRKIKEQFDKIYIEQATKANKEAISIYQETDQSLKDIKSNEFPSFIKSELALLYDEFISSYEDYLSYIERISKIYKEIQGRTLDELDIFSVARTDISKYTGIAEPTQLWNTDQNIEEAKKLYDEINSKRISIIVCLERISNTIKEWTNTLKSKKGPVSVSITNIIKTEEREIQKLIESHTSNIASISRYAFDLDKYKKDDKLDDAKIAYQDLKSRKKLLDDIVKQIEAFNARMNSYKDTINESREAIVEYIPCNLSETNQKQPSSVSAKIPLYEPEKKSATSATSATSIVEGDIVGGIRKRLNALDFASAEDKDQVNANIEEFGSIIKTDVYKYTMSVYEKMNKIKKMNQFMQKNNSLFGGAALYTIPDKSPIARIVMKNIKD